MLQEKLIETFQSIFSHYPDHLFFSPGRVNLIGEHLDYNNGVVLPFAIEKGIYAAVSPRTDLNFHVYSTNFPDPTPLCIPLSTCHEKLPHTWHSYIKGVLCILMRRKFSIPFGLNLLISGTLPDGSGLSSSACLEILLCKIFDTYYKLSLTPVEMAMIGKQVENDHLGLNSGIMDQFAIALGQKDKALLLNCEDQSYTHIPFALDGYKIIIMNTNKPRKLTDSKYNERFTQCQKALDLLAPIFHCKHLCQLTTPQLSTIKDILNDPILYRRVSHVITENERVHLATSALNANNMHELGQLLTASHYSLRSDYEVTGPELDLLVDAALENGVLGARMTGAGFGGCSICLVKKEASEKLIEKVGKIYHDTFGYCASFYETSASHGPQIRL